MTRRTLLQLAATSPMWGRPAAPPWLAGIYRELHIDAHFAQVPNPYENFDAGRAADILHSAGFQMVSIFAICNGGYSYFPTKLGVVHPGLKRDFTGEFSRALKQRGIRVLAYVSVGPDRRAAKDHPDWLRTAPPGQMCANSPWVEEAHIPQLQEIVSLYDVDGFFLDSVLGKFVRGVCECKWCKEDQPGAGHYRFLSRSGARYADRVIGALKPGLAFVTNHVWVSHNPVKPPASLRQLVWEPVPPYSRVLAADFSLEARYLSTQAVDNWSCMTTRGNGWGDYSLRDAETFRREAAILLANGGRPYFGDDSYPSGNPDPAVYKVYGEVNAGAAALEPYIRGCAPVKEIAVLLSAESMWAALPVNPPREWIGNPASTGVAGAHRVLAEEHLQFSILNSETLVETLGEYKVLILPEQRILSAAECAAIRRFVEAGGALIVTGETDWSLSDVLGIRNLGRAEVRRAFLRQEMDIQVNGPYFRIQATTAQPLLELVPPAIRQAPAEKPEGPAVTVNRFGKGQAIYCCVELFGAYDQNRTPALRRVAAGLLGRVFPPETRQILLENAHFDVEIALNWRQNDRFLHLLSASAGTVEGIHVRLRSSARPKRVSLVPEKKNVAFEWKEGWVSFPAQPLTTHSAYWIEV